MNSIAVLESISGKKWECKKIKGSRSRAPGKSDPWAADICCKSVPCEEVGQLMGEKAGADELQERVETCQSDCQVTEQN